MKMKHVSGVVLAGGQSRRMGQDKRQVTVAGISLLQRVLAIFEEVFDKTIIVVAHHSPVTNLSDYKVITDIIPGKGPVGGLHAGLSHCETSHAFLAACDMPFLEVPIVRRICDLFHDLGHIDVCMCKLPTGIQPMQGVYSKNCIACLEDIMKTESLSMHGLLNRSELNVKILDESKIVDIDPNFLSFMNVNTPSDLEMANKFLRK